MNLRSPARFVPRQLGFPPRSRSGNSKGSFLESLRTHGLGQ